MSALKLKPLEDSNLYKRRTTSKENLLQTVTVAGGDMIRSPRPDLDGTTSDHPSPSSPRLTAMSIGLAQQPPTTTHSPMHNFVPYPQYHPHQEENYYQRPKTPIRMASGAGTPFTNIASVGQKNVQFRTPAAGRSVYDGSSTPQQHRPPAAVPFERPANAHSSSVTTARNEGNVSFVQQPSPAGTYQNLPVIPPATPTTPGRRMESWEQFGRSDLQTVAAGGLVDVFSPPLGYTVFGVITTL
uniref:Uncharacterized protein n=1 Tax=Anopheles maculatus TaxID=74869 RepID=A0A182SIJ4_9DIPT